MRVLLDRRRHRVEVRLQVADVRERLRLEQDALVVAQRDRRRRRASSMSAADIGLPSGAIGRPSSTIIDVSLLRNTSSMKWLIEKQTRGSSLAALPLREARPEVATLAGGRVAAVLEEVALDVEHELVAGQRGARRVGIGRSPSVGMSKVPPGLRRFVARVASSAHTFSARSVVAAPHSDRRNCAARDSELDGVALAVVLRAPDGRFGNGRQRDRVELAVRAGPELDRQTRVFLTPAAHRPHRSDGRTGRGLPPERVEPAAVLGFVDLALREALCEQVLGVASRRGRWHRGGAAAHCR